MTEDRRAEDRRSRDRRADRRALVPAEQPASSASAAPSGASNGAEGSVFTAQMLGQTGQRRGLKGGPPVLDEARSTYLGAEYSGANERRPRPGKTTKTEV